MLQPGRSYNPSTYRYGFNGKEKDGEIKGEGNQLDYGMRVYYPRAGRFLSVDPLTQTYPWLSTYQYADNSPITFTDQDGLERAYRLPNGELYYQTPSDHLRLPIPNGAKSIDAADIRAGAKDRVQMTQLVVITGALVADATLTKGNIIKTLVLSQGLSLFEHNRAKTEEGRRAQDERINENATDLVVTAGTGEIVGRLTRSIISITGPNIIPGSRDIAFNRGAARGHLLKHADVLGVSGTAQELQNPTGLKALKNAASDIINGAEEIRHGSFGTFDDVLLYKKDNAIVVTNRKDNEFITAIDYEQKAANGKTYVNENYRKATPVKFKDEK